MPYRDLDDRRKYQRNRYRDRAATSGRRDAPAPVEEKRVLFSTRLPGQLVARMQKIKDEGIATGRYPWSTMSAVHEALLLKGFEAMAGDPFIDEMLQFLRAWTQINVAAQQRREAQGAIGKFKVEVSELLKIRAREQAVQYVHGVIHDLQQMSPSIWRDWAIAEIGRAYPALVKSQPIGLTFRAKSERRHHAIPVVVERRARSRGRRR